MKLRSDIELACTREKLRELEERYEARRREAGPNEQVHALTLRSLKRVINQLKEEIARYESRVSAQRVDANVSSVPRGADE